MDAKDELTASAVFWWADQSAGWIYLLPPLVDSHVLCIDPLPEITWLMHHSCRRVTIAYTSEARANEAGRLDAAGTDRIDWISLDELVEERAAPARRFDGVVIHDPQARIAHSSGVGEISRLIDALPKLMTERSFVYLGLKRRLSPFDSPPDPRAPRGTHPLWSHRQVVDRVRSAGFGSIRRVPYLLDRARVVDVLAAPYQATTNAHSWRERLKETILGPVGAPLLAPAVGYVGTRSRPSTSVVDEVHALVGGVLECRADDLNLTQFRLARGDKAILAFRHRARREGSAIAVITEDPSVLRGRREEARILARLARLSARVRNLVPRHYGEHSVGRYSCFVISAFEGVTLDADSSRLPSLTEQAMDFLNQLQAETSVPVVLDERAIAIHVTSIFEDAVSRNPLVAAILQTLLSQIEQQLAGRRLPLVFTHGDFKVENVMYRLADGRITGVIDWEHASPASLPLVDVLYLFLYNRTLRGMSWLEALDGLLDLPGLTSSERSLLTRHLQILRLQSADYWPLAALFVAHHIGRRVSLDQDTATYQELGEILVRHARRATSAAGPVPQNVS